MCHEPTAHPSIPADPTMPIACERIVLTAADASPIAAYVAHPHRPTGVGVVVLPDNHGLSRFYGDVAARLAEHGHMALAIDYFGRTAGSAERAADFPFMEHLVRLTRAGIDADLDAAIGYLRSANGGACQAVVTLGFCFGGRQSFLATTTGNDLGGAIGFYGYPGAINGAPGPTQRAGDIAAPILAIWGGADEGMPPPEVAAFDAALSTAGVAHEMVTYPGAPHSFFELEREEFAAASADAWRRVLAFIQPHQAAENATRA